MNEYDSSRIRDLLGESHDLEPTDKPEEADVLLLNTCSIREKAQEKVFHQLGRWRKLKQDNPDLIIGVGGCVASQEGDKILGVVAQKYDSVVSDSIKGVGDNLVIKVGEEEVNFNIKNFDKGALEKEMQNNPQLMSAFIKDQEGFSSFAEEYINARVLKENLNEIYGEIWKVAQAKALKKNAVGAKKPFVGNKETKEQNTQAGSGMNRTLDIIDKHN